MSGRAHPEFGQDGRFCAMCGEEYHITQMEAAYIPSKGNRFICHNCAANKPYSRDNEKFVHKPLKNGGFASSHELESVEGNIAVIHSGTNLLPTRDASISGPEFKTPVYLQESGKKQAFRTWEEAVDFGPNDESTGAHINVSWYDTVNDQPVFDMENAVYSIRSNWETLFRPLSNYLREHPEDCKRVFGRNFCYYATDNVPPYRHECFINTQHNTHVEYRLPKFISATQYFWCTAMCIEFTSVLKDWYFGRRTDTKTGQKLVKIFQKYASGKACCQREERNNHRNPDKNV